MVQPPSRQASAKWVKGESKIRTSGKSGSRLRPNMKASKQSLDGEVQSALKWLRSHATKATLEGMARYAIPSKNAYGVAMKDMKALGKKLGHDHELAAALWETG